MADDLNNSKALTPPDDTIRSALASAMAQHETPAETPPKPAPEAPAQAAESDSAETGTEVASEESGDQEPADGAGEAVEEKPGEEKPAATSGTEPPANWSAKDKATFKGLAPEAQKFLLDRHKAMEGDYIKKTQAIAAFKREYEPVDKIFEPYRDRMKAGGWTPAKLVEAWGNVEKRLMEGDGVNVVAGLVQGYKIDLGQVARTLGLRPRQQQANGNGAAQPAQPQHDPLSLSPDHPVVRQLNSIQERLAAEDRARADEVRRRQTAAETRVMGEIEEFKSAQDDKGNLLYPHFDDVEAAMAQLAQSANATGKPLSLKDLYETAVWANPSTRDAMLAARERAQQEKATEEARAKAARARKAASSVTGAPGSGQAPTGRPRTDLSLREQLNAAYGDHVGGRI